MISLKDNVSEIYKDYKKIYDVGKLAEDKQSFEMDFNREKTKRVFIDKYSLFDIKETRFIIECAGYKVSINVNDNGYGGISVNYVNPDMSKGSSILALGFTDNKYYAFRTKKLSDGKMDSGTEVLTPDDWSVEKVLDIMHQEVKDAWESEEWHHEADIIFTILRPALALAIEENRRLWSIYLGFWADKYQDMIDNENPSDDTIIEYNGFIQSLTEARDIIDGKRTAYAMGRLDK